MNLGFSTHWSKNMPEHMAGKPTYFIEKIWAGLISEINDINISHYEEYLNAHISLFGSDFGYNEMTINPKLHTIRKDEKNRWKAGNDIHFVINNRTPKRFQFAPVIPCISTQEIEFYWWKPSNPSLYKTPYNDIKNERYCDVYINGEVLNDGIEKLAINDGFDSVEDFFSYFNEDFKGKINHWTNLKY